MAPGYGRTPPRSGHTDQWLCLAQHVGLPTQLLDWTESALFATHCSLKEKEPVVWMLNPIRLNSLSYQNPEPPETTELPLSCHHSPDSVNIGSINIRGAWEQDKVGVALPAAFVPTYNHPRMAAQRSRFLVWGQNKGSLHDPAPDESAV
jgi:hypothetical protein